MPTYRSLNKLEFKAHMSVHSLVELPENEGSHGYFTRDRLGKKHALARSGLGKHAKSSKNTAALILLFCGAIGFFGSLPLEAAASAGKNTNVQVASGDLEPFSLDERLKVKEEKPTFYQDDSKTIGINENGDPSLSMRF